MIKHLLPGSGNFYKANLHCHTTISDGRKTPEEVAAVLDKRRIGWKGFESKYKKGLLKLYAQHAVSSMKGAYME